MTNRRGILKLATFNSSHYQFENEPFAKKNWPGLPLSPGRAVVFFSEDTHLGPTVGHRDTFLVKSGLHGTAGHFFVLHRHTSGHSCEPQWVPTRTFTTSSSKSGNQKPQGAFLGISLNSKRIVFSLYGYIKC